MTKTERLYLKVVLKDFKDDLGMLMDVTVSVDGSHTVNKMVFFQVDLETEQEHWVVFPREHYAFRLDVLKDEIVAEIKRVQENKDYSNSQKYKKILRNTTRKMVFQDGY